MCVIIYFFNPPKEADTTTLEEIINISAQPGFLAPLGGMHGLVDFDLAITKSIKFPQKGSIFLEFHTYKDVVK